MMRNFQNPCMGCALRLQVVTFPFWFSFYHDFHFSLMESFFFLWHPSLARATLGVHISFALRCL